MKINQFISEALSCSRRETDRLIKAGRVAMNDKVCTHGVLVKPDDVVTVDGKVIEKEEKEKVYIAFHKPVGITCTAAKHIEGNIIAYINYPERIFPVGRLDKASEGLILLTNDGKIANQILHGDHGHEKEYVVTVDKSFTDGFIHGMSCGVKIKDGMTKPCKVTRVDDSTFRIVLTQGMNRQIRRMSRAFGYTVTKLKRVRIMNIKLGELEVGKWRYLTDEELQELRGAL
ncbi:23S rRNA pseudouridine(2604) synthase RluF [Bacillus cytotoxicus]|uniref:Pseudouridine synthase n=2 Tax=Bacillus cytotoxicus TaxID=580165 RepID=A0AAX2CM30_9BACI|nr:MULTISPECIES: 23S rRNA pseudouridine(2604) synthase RluF [Bacillus cereus group]ABS23457.1 pseudouridine synthase [Bacillus cytotoxicus NVH 391-98]AWC30059.1 23S rRNA pseudouridine synthase F [Bacillus cytotoxicus]AWC34106.1 23S rRNA pseudouridine synthase F [Bacillus cytotoxicus]AWC38103.1 23S rRNA pseudouridine synthase F [Bacillus cytotoxicus]AWC42196.1 23S rRNA pseudouridine synthase F [Bacillus cytotoxicus]